MALRPDMITLAHLSDIHLAPLPPVRPTELIGKRITGYLNWKFKRQKLLEGDGLTRLVRHLREQSPDITAITGDLSNLALDAEANTVHNWLETVGPPEEVCLVPGNHDAYVRGQMPRLLDRWGAYATGETLDEAPFPYVRRIGDVAIIGCSSAVPTPPFFASGSFDKPQAERLRTCLKMLGDGGYFRVVLIHHPPNIENTHARLGLYGARRFREVVAEAGAELILHGHTHRSTIQSVPGQGKAIPVIGVAAAGAAQGDSGKHDPARYNLFQIQRVGPNWQCTMREYGFQRLSTDIVPRLVQRIY
jgi:3',5'-cyclic AMP phosphodiesterase CpdA